MSRRKTKNDVKNERIAAAVGTSPSPIAGPKGSQSDPVLPLDVLLENAKALFGVPSYTIRGAMSSAPVKEAYAVSEVRAYLDRIKSMPIR